ncbi:unnamed protein product, partial [Protopolystoma xenopodis]
MTELIHVMREGERLNCAGSSRLIVFVRFLASISAYATTAAWFCVVWPDKIATPLHSTPKLHSSNQVLTILCLVHVFLYFLLRSTPWSTIKPEANDPIFSFKEIQGFLIRAIRERNPTFVIPDEKCLLQNRNCYNYGRGSFQICPKICRIHNATTPTNLNRTDPLELRPPVPLITAQSSFHSEKTWRGLYPGGLWSPYSVGNSHCNQQSGLAVVIPFRNRHRQLNTMLPILHQGLRRQGVCYRIFVVEQAGDDLFNRGGTSNVGFLEAATRFQFDCVLFHDTDLVPMNPRIPYACSQDPNELPLHMSANVSQFGWKLLYQGLVGGIIRMPMNQFVRVNGYSNKYWGWGGEDDDLRVRLVTMGLSFKRLP